MSFVIAPYFLFVSENKYLLSVVLTGVAFIIVGATRGSVTGQSRVKTSTETLLIGGVAAAIAYVVGYFIRHVVLS